MEPIHPNKNLRKRFFVTDPPETITCVDCLGTCHLISFARPDEPIEAGDIVTYRCADCGDRWDLVWEDDDETEDVYDPEKK